MLLMVIVSEFAYSMRTRVNISRNFKESTQAYYIAIAGLHHAIKEIIQNEMTPETRSTVEFEESESEEVVWRVNTQTTIRFSRSKLTCSFDLPADRDEKALILKRGSDPVSLCLPPTRANRRFLGRMRGAVEKS